MTTAPVGCLDGEQAIRDALAEGPTSGPWVANNNEGYSLWTIWSRMTPSGNGTPGPMIAQVIGDSAEADANAALVAACGPETMRAVMAELDRLRSASRQEGWTFALRELLDGIHAGRFIPLDDASEGYCRSLVEAAEAALTAAENSGWISVGERLPSHEQEVICTGFEGNDPAKQRWQQFATFHKEGTFYSSDHGEELYPPTHWKLPPAAPHQSQEAQGDRHG